MGDDILDREFFPNAQSERQVPVEFAVLGSQQRRLNGSKRDRDLTSRQAPERNCALFADFRVRRKTLVRQHIERGDGLRTLGVATRREQIKEGSDQLLKKLRLADAIDDHE